MKKWKDIPATERGMLIFIVILLLAVIVRWNAVKEGIGRGFGWFDRDAPAASTELEITIPADTFPPAQPDIQVMPAPENE